MGSSRVKKPKIIKEIHAQIKTYAWHAHDYREVLVVLGSVEDGLSMKEVFVRTNIHGKNEFTKQKGTSLFVQVLNQLKSPLAIVLLFAFILTSALEEYVDASVIALALIVAVLISLVQEGKASKAFAKLAESQVHTATVFRDGERHEILARDLVPGDIVELQSGEQVPADVRLTKVKNLEINESALTGEWQAVKKHTNPVPIGTPFADRENMAWKGTFISTGYGIGVVIAIGDNTEVGELALSLKDIKEESTPVQIEMRKVSFFMLYVIAGLVLILFLIGLFNEHSLHDMTLMAIAIAVASVPEGLPAAVTIVLAVGMESLLKRGGLVRNLLAAETLGSTTYVLTDKTGTLTQAKMAITGVIFSNSVNMDYEAWHDNAEIKNILDIALCATDAYSDNTKNGVVMRGESVEKAILEKFTSLDLDAEVDSLRANRMDYLAFTSENRFAAGLVKEYFSFKLCINGAPEYMLAEASHHLVGEEEVELSVEDRSAFFDEIDVQNKEGKRLVAVAYKKATSDIIDTTDIANILKNTVFVGILILNDPVRPGVKEAIAGVQSAGAKVILITGDNPATALNIARQVGIAGMHESAITGDELAELSDEELLQAVEHVHVFARILPKQKMRIAEVLQRSGEIVAMTGDGINDAPALRKANIGIAIGSGTQVAKESSDLVLVNDSFEIIYAAIEEGRRIIANLRKIIGYLLSTSLTEIVLISAALLTGGLVPLLPVQILWGNIIEEGLMSVAFAFEKGEKNAMKRKPRDIHEEGILSKEMLQFLFLVVFVLSCITLSLYGYLRFLNLDIDIIRSVMFLAISLDSLFIAFAFRSLSVPIWRLSFFANRFFIGAFLLSFVFLFGALSIPFMRGVLSYTPLPATLLLIVLGTSFAGFLVVELSKLMFFGKRN